MDHGPNPYTRPAIVAWFILIVVIVWDSEIRAAAAQFLRYLADHI